MQAAHTSVFIWNIVGGTGPAQSAVNSSGATPPFERPKFPFLRSGSAVLQAFSRHRRPQRPRWQHFTGNMGWQRWPDGPPRSAHGHTKHWHKRAAWVACNRAFVFAERLNVYALIDTQSRQLLSLRSNKSRTQCTNSSNVLPHRHCGRRGGGRRRAELVCVFGLYLCVCGGDLFVSQFDLKH